MSLALAFPEHLGRPAARVLQTAATVRALARMGGGKVHFLAGWFFGLDRRLAELGLGPQSGLQIERLPMAQPGPGLRIPFSWGRPYEYAALRRLSALARRGVGAVWLRHLKLAAFLLKNRAAMGLKVIYEAHEVFHQTAREEGMSRAGLEKLTRLEMDVLGRADRVIAISKPLADEVSSLVAGRGAVPVAPSGVDEGFFGIGDDKRQNSLAAYAGGLGPWKGVETLVRAMAHCPAARLEILGGEPGSGDWGKLEKLTADLGLQGRVTMRPRAGGDQVRELLGRAQVAVWPGTARQRIAARYTSPLKLFEYLAAGCAVVAPNVPAAQSVLTHGRNAVLFEPDDPASLAAALNGLFTDKGLCRGLAQAGRELAGRYTWEKRAAVILQAAKEPA